MLQAFEVRALPLVRRAPLHNLRTLELHWQSQVAGAVQARADLAGHTVVAEFAAVAGENRVRLEVLEPAAPVPLAVELRATGGSAAATARLTLTPVRPWTVFVVHHSHLDIGYTDVQPHVMQLHLGFLDEAIALCERTRAWPEGARFKWTIEVTYPLLEYVRQRTPAMVERLVGCVRAGQIELAAMFASLHAETCSLEELVQSLRDARRLADVWGVPLASALQSDVPGQPWSLPQLLFDSGIKYLALAPNNHRAPVHAHRGFPRPFYWRTADGNRVLTWFTDDPVHVYQEGNVAGFIESYAQVLAHLPGKLADLEAGGYPYAALHLRCQGAYADNGPPNIKVAEITRTWNEHWLWPKVRVATNAEFFQRLEADHAAAIPELSGDWPDWWADGTGSAAREMRLVREAHGAAGVAAAAAAARSLGEPAPAAPDLGGMLQTAWREMLLFDEHTWGAARPLQDEDAGFGSQGRQWALKSAHAHRAHALAEEAKRASIAELGRRIATGAHPVALVFNSTGRPRRDLVELELPRTLGVDLQASLELRDLADDRLIPFEWVPPATHDPGRVRFVSPEVPALGYRLLELRVGAGSPVASCRRQQLEPPYALTLENDALAVQLQPARAGIRSIRAKANGLEWVDADAAYGFNSYIYDRYVKDDERTINHRLIKRHVPNAVDVAAASISPIDATLTYRADGGEGAACVDHHVRLYRELPELYLENVVAKRAVDEKEGVYFAFPFAGRRAWRYTIPGGTCALDGESLPGAMTDWPFIESALLTVGHAQPLLWGSPDAGLVQFGDIATVQPPRPAARDCGHVFSYVCNNLWSTNFAPRQSGELRFRYVIAAAERGDAYELAAFGRRVAQPLAAAVVPAGQSGPWREPLGCLCTLTGAGVIVESIAPGSAGGLLLRLRECLGKGVQVTIAPKLGKASRALQVSPVEVELARVPMAGGRASVSLEPHQLVNVLLQ